MDINQVALLLNESAFLEEQRPELMRQKAEAQALRGTSNDIVPGASGFINPLQYAVNAMKIDRGRKMGEQAAAGLGRLNKARAQAEAAGRVYDLQKDESRYQDTRGDVAYDRQRRKEERIQNWAREDAIRDLEFEREDTLTADQRAYDEAMRLKQRAEQLGDRENERAYQKQMDDIRRKHSEEDWLRKEVYKQAVYEAREIDRLAEKMDDREYAEMLRQRVVQEAIDLTQDERSYREEQLLKQWQREDERLNARIARAKEDRDLARQQELADQKAAHMRAIELLRMKQQMARQAEIEKAAKTGTKPALKPSATERKDYSESLRLFDRVNEIEDLRNDMSPADLASLDQPLLLGTLDWTPATFQRWVENSDAFTPKARQYLLEGSKLESRLSQLLSGLALTQYEIAARQTWSPMAPGVNDAQRQMRMDALKKDLGSQTSNFVGFFPQYVPEKDRDRLTQIHGADYMSSAGVPGITAPEEVAPPETIVAPSEIPEGISQTMWDAMSPEEQQAVIDDPSLLAPQSVFTRTLGGGQ